MQKIRSLPAIFLALYCCGVLVLAAQPVLTLMQPGFQGILYKGGDESQYIMRIQQAMSHPWTDVSNSIITGPSAPRGLQMTFLEMISGSVFSVSPFSAPVIAIALSVLFAPLTMPLFALLAERFGVKRTWSVIGSIVLFFLILGPLRRIVHQSWSFPFLLFVSILLVDWFRAQNIKRSVILGFCLGLLPGIYLWAWMYLWATFGVLLCLLVLPSVFRRDRAAIQSEFVQSAITGLTALLVASPFLILAWMNSHDLASNDASVRSSLIHAREFESIPRSIILFLFAIVGCTAIFRKKDHKEIFPLAAMLIALVLTIHPQFLDGLVLSFWTHEYPYVCMVSVLSILVLFSKSPRSLWTYATSALACVFLLGAFFDYKGRASVFTPIPHWNEYQQLHDSINALRSMSHQTVLSDPSISLIVGTYTDHDVVFTPFLRHTLVTTRELADRYCLTEFAKGGVPDTEWLANDIRELSAAGRPATQKTYEEDVQITREACANVMAHPKESLKKYNVDMLLWDEKNHPSWQPPVAFFALQSQGAGWSLWTVR